MFWSFRFCWFSLILTFTSTVSFNANAAETACTPQAPIKPHYSFLSDWQTLPAGGWAQMQAIDGDIVVDPKMKTNHGFVAAHVMVKSGDDPLHLQNKSERAEVLMMKDVQGHVIPENEKSGTQYYALSYFFPPEWKASAVHEDGIYNWAIIFQLHGPDDAGLSPSFSINAGRELEDGPPVFAVEMESGGPIALNTWPADNIHHYQFDGFDAIVPLGKWVDFIIRITYTVDNKGSFTIWRRDEGDNCFHVALDVDHVPTLQFSDKAVKDHYWKQGLYRSAQSWTDEFWMGPLARGSSFADVENAAFGTNNGANTNSKDDGDSADAEQDSQ